MTHQHAFLYCSGTLVGQNILFWHDTWNEEVLRFLNVILHGVMCQENYVSLANAI